MRISDLGLKKLKEWEGERRSAYKDAVGLWTIGVGHLITSAELNSGTITINGTAVAWKNGLSETQVLDLLRQDAAKSEAAVNKDVKVPLSQNQFDALVSFTFNEGEGAIHKSTLLKDINAGDMADVPNQFRLWNKAGNPLRVVPGLTTRRENEIKLWNGEFGTGSAAATGPTTPDPPASPSPPPVGTKQPRSTSFPSYTVVHGDTLDSVASRFRVSVPELADANDLVNPADFKPGLVIHIPVAHTAASSGDHIAHGSSGPTSYTVVQGDTLESVASRFGTSVAELAQANNLINPADFKPGLVVQIP